MGKRGRHKTVHRSRPVQQHHPVGDGAAEHEAQNARVQPEPQQACTCLWRLRFRKDIRICKTEHDAAAFQPGRDRSKGDTASGDRKPF